MNSLKRIVNCVIADILFQIKQGFYVVYGIVSIIYIAVLGQMPDLVKDYAIPGVVFSDPSVLGLFFVGGIALLEKEQGVIYTLMVTPLKLEEYLIGKIISLGLISIISSLIITVFTVGDRLVNYPLLITGVLLSSIFFTLLGVIVSSKSKNLNSFFVKMVQRVTIVVLPAYLVLPFPNYPLVYINPAAWGLRIVYGAIDGHRLGSMAFGLGYLFISNLLLFMLTCKIFKEEMVYGG